MDKMETNLMMISKILLFSNNLLEEDIDYKYFSDLFSYNINFINNRLNDFWDEYIKFIKIHETNNFIKTYYFILKRFNKFLLKLKESILKSDDFHIDEVEINSILNSIKNRINLIKEHNYRLRSIDSEKQFINEEEYSILFQDIEEKD